MALASKPENRCGVHLFVGLVEGGRFGVVWHGGGREMSAEPAHLAKAQRRRIGVSVGVGTQR